MNNIPHSSGLTISGRREVSVVGPSGVLDGDGNTIVASTALPEVVVLEVEGRLNGGVRSNIVAERSEHDYTSVKPYL